MRMNLQREERTIRADDNAFRLEVPLFEYGAKPWHPMTEGETDRHGDCWVMSFHRPGNAPTRNSRPFPWNGDACSWHGKKEPGPIPISGPLPILQFFYHEIFSWLYRCRIFAVYNVLPQPTILQMNFRIQATVLHYEWDKISDF